MYHFLISAGLFALHVMTFLYLLAMAFFASISLAAVINRWFDWPPLPCFAVSIAVSIPILLIGLGIL